MPLMFGLKRILLALTIAMLVLAPGAHDVLGASPEHAWVGAAQHGQADSHCPGEEPAPAALDACCSAWACGAAILPDPGVAAATARLADQPDEPDRSIAFPRHDLPFKPPRPA